MDRILLLSKRGKGESALMAYLLAQGQCQVETASDGCAGRQMFLETNYDLVLINAPLEDELGDELAELVSRKTAAGVVILLNHAFIDRKAGKMERSGVMVVGKPIVKGLLPQAIHMAYASKCRIQVLQRENEKLAARLNDIKHVNRAKWLLVKNLDMTEEQAHKYIETQAMEHRISKGELSRRLLGLC